MIVGSRDGILTDKGIYDAKMPLKYCWVAKSRKMRIRRTSTFLFMSMVLLVFTTSCSVEETPIETDKPSAAQEEKTVVESIGSYVVYPTFADLAFNSDIIVIVQAKSTLDIVNTARDIDDHSKPDPNYFSIGQVYELKIESYLSGMYTGIRGASRPCAA